MLKFLTDVKIIAESFVFVFGLLLACLVLSDVAEDWQLAFAYVIFGLCVIHGAATVTGFVVRKGKAVRTQ